MDETIYTLFEHTEPRTFHYWMPGMLQPAQFDKSWFLLRQDYTDREYLLVLRLRDGTARPLTPKDFTQRIAEIQASITTTDAGEHWPEWLVIYQQTEQVESRQWSEHIASIFQQLQLVLDPIDWQGHGRGAYIFSNGIEVGAIADFHTLEPQQILDRVRVHLVAHAANAHAGTGGRDPYLITWLTPEAEMESLCRVRLDDVDAGISIAEYIRDGSRVYEYYGGPLNT